MTHPAPAFSDFVASLEELRDVVADLDAAEADLPEKEREAYKVAKESVVDARRKAETLEGLLQVN